MAASKTAVRFATANGFVDTMLRVVRPLDAAIWFTLWRHADGRNRVCIAHSQIAEMVGVHRTTARRCVERLIDAGVVRVIRRGGLRNGSTEYQIRGVNPDALV